ncbi:MAG: cell division protein FtsL [Acetatifactor sp.]|nr:cell division protein FtsL [Acetatifactor sp.]
MSQNRRTYRQAAYEKSGSAGRRTEYAYNYGNTAHRLQVQPRRQGTPEPVAEPVVRKNRDKARHMNLGYVLFLAAALCTAALVLVNYIQLQAELTNRIKEVAAKESQLNSLKLANDEEYNRIMSSIDLEEIKRIAIGELGMTYAQEGQVILYQNEKNDYMRRAEGNGQ